MTNETQESETIDIPSLTSLLQNILDRLQKLDDDMKFLKEQSTIIIDDIMFLKNQAVINSNLSLNKYRINNPF